MHLSPATATIPSPSASSASSASSALAPRTPRSASPSASPVEAEDPDLRTLTRREEAFTLYCQGYRSPAIASLLGIPERTVRSWIASTLKEAAEDSRTRRDHQLRLAIESQRAIVKAAWHAFDRAARAERLTLEHLQNAIPLNVDDPDLAADLDAYDASPSPPHVGARHAAPGQGVRIPHLPAVGARYLQIVLHAQREIARLSGLYDLPASVHDPNSDAGRPMQIVIRRDPHLPREQLVAWTAFRQQWDVAHPDYPVPPDDLVFPPDGAPLCDFAPDDLDDPDDPDEPNPHRAAPGDMPAADDAQETAGSMHSAALADEPAGDLTHHCPAPPHTESPAETANPDPTSLVPDALVPDPIAPPSPEPSDGVPAAIPLALLPRFRHRGRLGRPSLLRQGFGTP